MQLPSTTNHKPQTTNQTGFTLIELLVVIAVLGILSGVIIILIPQFLPDYSRFSLILLLAIGITGSSLAFYYLKYVKKSNPKPTLSVERDKKRKEDIERLQAMVEAYYKLKGVYPSPTQFEEMKASLEPEPKDPLDGQVVGETDNVYGFHYDNWDTKTSKNTTATYRLWAFLENENDPLAKDGKYLATPETYGKELEPPYPPSATGGQLQKPETAAFVPAPQAVYLPAQDKITQVLLIIFSLVVFIITIVNAYMVYKLNQLTAYLMQLLGKGF